MLLLSSGSKLREVKFVHLIKTTILYWYKYNALSIVAEIDV